MAITSGFFNSVNGDRRYNAEQIGRYLQHLVSDGVYAYDSTSLQVLANDGMVVEVQPGQAMLDHHFLDNDAPITFTLSAGGSQDRIDAVIMYVDMTERCCGITVKEGTPAASPVPPVLTHTDVRKEYMLAMVRVPRLAGSITQSSITDTRANSAVCGWVTGLIKQVDTAALFAQWQAAYEEAYADFGDYLKAQQAAWETFFASVTEDNALPAPSLDDAGKSVVVNAAGTGYKLQNIEPGTPANLLDNSDFSVAQAGYFAAHGTRTFIADRWETLAGSQPFSVSFDAASGLAVEPGGNRNTSILQYLEVPTRDKVFTFAVNIDDVVCVLSGPATTTTSKKESGVCEITLGPSTRTDKAIYCRIDLYGAGVQNVKWAALYEGEYTTETLPKYQPKGHAAELQECRRYFQRVNPGYIPFAFGWSNNTTAAAIRATLPCSPMRIQPTVTFAGTLNNVRLQFNQGAVNIVSVDGVHYRPEAEYIAIFMKPNNVYVGPFVAYCISDYEIFELSADL